MQSESYYQRNREKCKAYSRKWYAEHPDYNQRRKPATPIKYTMHAIIDEFAELLVANGFADIAAILEYSDIVTKRRATLNLAAVSRHLQVNPVKAAKRIEELRAFLEKQPDSLDRFFKPEQ